MLERRFPAVAVEPLANKSRTACGSPDLARNLLCEMQARGRHFPRIALKDAAWAMLLDLYVRQCAGLPTPVSSACIGAHAPPTTALRWIGAMEAEGLLSREPDASDGRRILILLTARTMAAMATYLDQIAATRQR